MSTPGEGLDAVVNKLDYTFIDIPDLVDADSDDLIPEPEPIYERSSYAFNVTPTARAAHVHHSSLSSQPALNSASTGTYWQQLQQGAVTQHAQQFTAQELAPGGLGASLLGAMAANNPAQQVQHSQGLQLQPNPVQQPWQQQQQVPSKCQDTLQQQGPSSSAGRGQQGTVDAGTTSGMDAAMDEG